MDEKRTRPGRRLNRREFVVGLGGAALAARLSFAVPSRSPPIAVAGAGLAGLAAAYELKRSGLNVVVIEQASHAGGRVRTVRDYFAGDAWVDVGAQSVGSGYKLCVGYCRDFGLPLVPPPVTEPRPDTLLRLRHTWYRGSHLRADPSLWPLELREEERPLAPFGLLSSYLMPVARDIGLTENVLDRRYAHYDAMSLLEFLRARNASPAAVGLIERSLNYNSLDTVSALSALRDATRRLAPQVAMHIDGGNDRLPGEFAKRLSGEIRYSTSLEGVATGDAGVRLRVKGPGGEENLDASRVILALPFPALRRVSFDPALPGGRQKMIDALPYTQIAKTHVQTQSRFWEKNGPVSAMYTDSRFERVFDMSSTMPGARGLLLNWINGAGLEPLQKLSPEEHADRVVGWMKSVWPAHANQFEKALTTNWGNTYSGGAYSHYAPGQLQKFAPELPKPIGRLHFAGEHTELVEPGMEGALTSGLRAAREVVATELGHS